MISEAMDDLVRGLKAGEGAAFERLVRDHGDRIYRFVKRLAGDQQAEDLTQEVFVRVHRSVGAFQPGGSFEAWLFTIANNLCIDALRRRRPEALTHDFLEAAPAAGAKEPLEELEDEERRQAILEAVGRLPLAQRQVFLLREEAGLSFREIAEMLDCPLNTALGRMHYALEHLRRTLKAYGMR